MSQQFTLFARMGKDLPLTILHELTRELKASSVMTAELVTISSTDSMRHVKAVMREHRISGIPVVDDGILKGVISVEDLIRALERQALDLPVSEFMTTNLITAHSEEPVLEALKRLEETGVGRLLVLNGDERLAGMLTKGDIVAGLLHALQEAYAHAERLARENQPRYFFDALVSDETSLILRYRVRVNDFTHGGQASAKIKKALLQIGASPQLSRRVAIATYEAEINLIIHTTDGGHIVAEIRPDQIVVVAHDSGPGIPDVALACQPGYSTASELAREMGFGAGMGLVNIDRCADEMDIWSAVGVGTRVEMRFDVPPEEAATG
ncbi:MAG: CBS domain-containing protein [Anaerolineae bacterium]|nr:CBS domain-containing protein [Anaerolineae bacterium]